MREVLRGIPDYAVFASTAMYLHGKEKGIEEMQVLPGDFDGVVPDESTLKRVRERLANVPGVEFKNEGELKPIGNDSKYLKGDIVVRVDDQDVRYPFEFFTVSNRIIPKEVFAKQEKIAGLNVLNFEGLQNQYINNLAFESKVKKSATEVAGFLLNPTVAEKLKAEMAELAEEDSAPFLKRVMEQYQLEPEQVRAFYEEADRIQERQEDEDAVGVDITPSMAKLLSGYNIKIPKRLKNIGELRQAQRVEL